ncbi:MAG TPA: hypothetical protein VKE96_04745, partial [Vicinamibacterales bacterium]|nr:hypothetical protein [Vicinamibacterales bacterium]
MPSQLLLAVGVLFASVAIAIGYVTFDVLQRRAPIRRRLQGVAGANVLTADLPLAADQLDPRLVQLNRFLPKSPKDMTRLQRRMARAGFRGATPTLIYSIVEFGVPVLLLLLCVSLLGPTRGLFVGGPTAILAYILPGFWLSRQIEKRKKLIANGLPDALDLLIVCIEAGMGLDQGVAKAAEELAVSHPPLA